MLLLTLVLRGAGASAQPVPVPNGGFETMSTGRTFPDDWQPGIGGGARATISVDDVVRHSGLRSVRITNRSPLQAFVYALCSSSQIPVQPSTTYVAQFWVRGQAVRGCHFAASFQGGGERRQDLPSGGYDWAAQSCTFTTPEGCRVVSLGFASDDVTEGLWIDDVTLAVAAVQRANIAERRYAKAFPGIWPRSKEPVARRLVVFDCSRESSDVRMVAAALQGLVNRRRPRLYILNPTDPPGQDEFWLRYMQQKGYTGPGERVGSLAALIARFRGDVKGVIVTDPDLPGSVSAAWMLAGLKDALPASPAMAQALKLPVVMDLRGRWKRNVDAYRYVYDRYWPQMDHHVLAWEYPLSDNHSAQDYVVEFRVFTFWVSSPADKEKGADPPAEEEFVDELLANTPGNVPVMGWPNYGDTRGTTEYSAVRWLSEYGKFVPGTEFCSNLSVHSAIRPDPRLLIQRHAESPDPAAPEPGKVYLSVNVIDSGDALWYWMRHQLRIWGDPVRGAVPVGWCMNVTLGEALPLVQQWYVEHATANDTFFAGPSGLGYMNTQAFGARFRPADRERVWREYVRLTSEYCRRAGIEGIELYDGGWGEKTPPPGVLERFTRGVKGLRYILADLGRHDSVKPDTAAYLLDGVPVFHTLTRYQVWSSSQDVARYRMAESNAWLTAEIAANTPKARPAFMSAMAISWYYTPSWFKDLRSKLPPEYVLVSPGTLARLYGSR